MYNYWEGPRGAAWAEGAGAWVWEVLTGLESFLKVGLVCFLLTSLLQGRRAWGRANPCARLSELGVQAVQEIVFSNAVSMAWRLLEGSFWLETMG